MDEIFEDYLKSHLPKVKSFHPYYESALSDMILAGGKRFRPILLLSIVKAYEPLLIPSALPVALAIEVFHTYSLIHDDLPAMDDASLRRGHETLHMRYDEATAVLAGDALNTDAFLFIAQAPLRADVRIKLVELLALNGGSQGMVLGQALDCYFENKPLQLEQIEFLHTNKTAKLIATSFAMGALIANLQKSIQDELYTFGIDLGVLFQVQDDIIDVTQSEQEAGKTTNNDKDKNSFVKLLGLDESICYANALADNLKSRFERFDAPLKEILDTLVKSYLYRHKN
jgi:farnesyl diphosphate synthase